MRFVSPTYGKVTIEEMMMQVKRYLSEDPKADYKLVIGTDSHTTRKHTVFVTALIVQRIGKGACFYFRKKNHKMIEDLRHRVYMETELSLRLMDTLQNSGLSAYLIKWPIEVHLDIGSRGETRKLIQEVVGWVTSVGYIAKIKPDAYGASAVADRYTK